MKSFNAAPALIETLARHGCRLRVVGERLQVQDPDRMLTDALRAELREHRAELLALLRADTNGPQHDKNVMMPAGGSDVEAFAIDCLVWEAEAQTRGVDIIASLKAWRIACKLPDDAATWAQVADTLIAHGCTSETTDQGALFFGVGLRVQD